MSLCLCRRDVTRSSAGEVGPAEKAGVTPGDVLVAVNGTTVAFLTYSQVLSMIRKAPRPFVLRFGKVSPFDDDEEDEETTVESAQQRGRAEGGAEGGRLLGRGPRGDCFPVRGLCVKRP